MMEDVKRKENTLKQITIKLNDGTEITAQVDEDELAKLTKPKRARTGYERVNNGEIYYYMKTNDVDTYHEGSDGFPRVNFNNGNYVNNGRLCQDRFRARVLHDRLEQWQALNDKPVDWDNNNKPKFEIKFDYQQNKLKVDCEYVCRSVDAVYFSTYKKAEEAIDVFRDELMWYYTEYRSRLDEKRTEAEA